MVCHDEIIVDCFRNPNKADIRMNLLSIAGQLAYCIHRIIAAYVQKITDMIAVKLLKDLRIHGMA